MQIRVERVYAWKFMSLTLNIILKKSYLGKNKYRNSGNVKTKVCDLSSDVECVSIYYVQLARLILNRLTDVNVPSWRVAVLIKQDHVPRDPSKVSLHEGFQELATIYGLHGVTEAHVARAQRHLHVVEAVCHWIYCIDYKAHLGVLNVLCLQSHLACQGTSQSQWLVHGAEIQSTLQTSVGGLVINGGKSLFKCLKQTDTLTGTHTDHDKKIRSVWRKRFLLNILLSSWCLSLCSFSPHMFSFQHVSFKASIMNIII